MNIIWPLLSLEHGVLYSESSYNKVLFTPVACATPLDWEDNTFKVFLKKFVVLITIPSKVFTTLPFLLNLFSLTCELVNTEASTVIWLLLLFPLLVLTALIVSVLSFTWLRFSVSCVNCVLKVVVDLVLIKVEPLPPCWLLLFVLVLALVLLLVLLVLGWFKFVLQLLLPILVLLLLSFNKVELELFVALLLLLLKTLLSSDWRLFKSLLTELSESQWIVWKKVLLKNLNIIPLYI